MVKRLRSCLTQLHKDESGQGLVEYALVVGFLVLAAVSALPTIASDISTIFNRVSSALGNASSTT